MAFVATAQEDSEDALIEDEEVEFEDIEMPERTSARVAVKHIFPDAVFGSASFLCAHDRHGAVL